MKIYNGNIRGFEYEIIVTPNKNQKYCLIGTKVGGKDYIADKEYNHGLAHFLEHKLLMQENGEDGYNMLERLGVRTNAYTSDNKTVYYFSGIDILEPFEFLIKSFFNPHFNEEDINNEKNIIKREISMVENSLDYKMVHEILTTCFNNHPISYSIAGTHDDIDKITKDEIEDFYKYYYKNNNCKLVLVGDINPDVYISILEKYVPNNEGIVEKNNLYHLVDGVNKTIYYDDLQTDKFTLAIRINKDYFSDEESLLLDAYFNQVFNQSSKIFQNLLDKHIIDPSFYYDNFSSKYYKMFIITSSSQYLKKSVDTIKNIFINGFEEEELLYDNYLKRKVSTIILGEDSQNFLGNNCLNFLLNDDKYSNYREFLLKYRIKDTTLAKKLFNEASYFEFYFKKSE